MPPRPHQQLRPNLMKHSHRKIRRSSIIHRNDDHSRQRTSKENRNPLRAVLAPQHHPVAPLDPASREFPRESRCNVGDAAI